MESRPRPARPATGGPATGGPRLRWALRLAAAIRWSAVAAGVGLLIAAVSLLGDDLCSDDSRSFGAIATVGATVHYAGVAVATLSGLALLVVGRLQPDWRRSVLLLVPLTWLLVIALWAVAFATCGFDID